MLPNIFLERSLPGIFIVRMVVIFVSQRLLRPTETCVSLKLPTSNLYVTLGIPVRLKSKRQRNNTITFYLRDISTPLVGVVFKHID